MCNAGAKVVLHSLCVRMFVSINSRPASGLELTSWQSPGNVSVSEHKSSPGRGGVRGGGEEGGEAGVMKLARWAAAGEMWCDYKAAKPWQKQKVYHPTMWRWALSSHCVCLIHCYSSISLFIHRGGNKWHRDLLYIDRSQYHSKSKCLFQWYPQRMFWCLRETSEDRRT